jgi:hypothetical protein
LCNTTTSRDSDINNMLGQPTNQPLLLAGNIAIMQRHVRNKETFCKRAVRACIGIFSTCVATVSPSTSYGASSAQRCLAMHSVIQSQVTIQIPASSAKAYLVVRGTRRLLSVLHSTRCVALRVHFLCTLPPRRLTRTRN